MAISSGAPQSDGLPYDSHGWVVHGNNKLDLAHLTEYILFVASSNELHNSN
jgi:hypothetical protein